ncbi:hypothetical protein BJ912DRAFT_928420 [Pholiota molesta]|nr:hypothetical protein BJ912DRAFT_928420 [Pholiota molesta]
MRERRALLGAASGADALAGTLRPAKALKTVAGKHYSIGFFHASSFASPSQEAAAFADGPSTIWHTSSSELWRQRAVNTAGLRRAYVLFRSLWLCVNFNRIAKGLKAFLRQHFQFSIPVPFTFQSLSQEF